MSTFKERNWHSRMMTMGDTAENAFLAVCPNAHRIGLNRPNFDVRGMIDTMRYSPDFMTSKGFYEVMGCASRGDSLLKVKLEKLSALQSWTCIGPVNLWIWDSSKKRYWDAPLEEWMKACYKYGDVAKFSDNNKPYFALHIHNFPVEPERQDV